MNAIQQLTGNLLKYAEKPEWAPLLAETWQHHIAFTAHLFNGMREEQDTEEITEEAISNILHKNQWDRQLFGLVFEDFATLELDKDAPAPNFALAYLKRAGWRELPVARRYLQALAESRPSLYEVLEVKLDEGLRLQDRLNPGEPIWVSEQSATHYLHPWDILYARVVRPEADQPPQITGGLLRFAPGDGAVLLDMTHAMFKQGLLDQERPELAQLAFAHWFISGLGRLTSVLDMKNSDGHALILCTAHIPLRVLPGFVEQKLDDDRDWERQAPGQGVWHKTRAASRNKLGGFDTLIGEQRSLIATVEISGRSLILQTNSEERLDEALSELRERLGPDALGQPRIERQDPIDILHADKEEGREAPILPPEPELMPEQERAIVKDMMDTHYRRVLRQRIPWLGDKTPRIALRTKSGRQKVIEWLKIIDNGARRQGYDVGWMWEELGLAEERYR